MSDNDSRESLLELAEEQIEDGRRWAAYATLMGAYGCEPGNQGVVTQVCDLLAEIESVESAAWFVLRDAGIRWDLVRPDAVETPEELFHAMLLADSAGPFSWEVGRNQNEAVIQKVWNTCRQAADHLTHMHERFPDQIKSWARKMAHAQGDSLNTRAVGLFLARLGDPACVECFLPTDSELDMLLLPDEHAWGSGFTEELRKRLAALELYCEKSPAPVQDSRILVFAVLCLNWPKRQELNLIDAVQPILPSFGIEAIEAIVAASRGEMVWPTGKVLRFDPQWVELVANVIREFPAISGAGQLRLIAETGPFERRAPAAELLKVVEHGPTKIDWSSCDPD